MTSQPIDNSSLLNALHDAASALSFYHSGWDSSEITNRERSQYEAVKHRFYNLKEIAEERGIFQPDEFKRYLV